MPGVDKNQTPMGAAPARKPQRARVAAPATPLARTRRARRLAVELAVEFPDAGCELDFTTPLELAVATILSAQSTDARVNLVTPALFAKYRTASDYAGADRAELEEMVRTTGFFRNKSTSLIGLGRAVVEQFDGVLPHRLAELVTLPGFGRKTANVVLGHAFGIPGITVDTHVGRLVRRWGLTEQSDPVRVELELNSMLPRADWTTFSDRTIFHGRRVCHAKKPACGACYLAPLCPSFGAGPVEPPAAAPLVVGAERPHLLALVGLPGVGMTSASRADQPIRLTGARLTPDTQLPDWLAPIVGRIDGSTVADLLPRPALSAPRAGRRSAVLMLFADGPAGPDLLLTARASTLRAHAGQPAFPGGKQDDGEDAVQTALREAAEETGLQTSSVTPAALFPDLFLGPSGFLVSPVLGYWHSPGPVGPVDRAETAAVARVPVAELVDPAHRGRVRHPSGYVGPAFEVAGMVVWGFTAGLVEVLLDLGGWRVPWDQHRYIPLPALGRELPDPEAGHLGDPIDDDASADGVLSGHNRGNEPGGEASEGT